MAPKTLIQMCEHVALFSKRECRVVSPCGRRVQTLTRFHTYWLGERNLLFSASVVRSCSNCIGWLSDNRLQIISKTTCIGKRIVWSHYIRIERRRDARRRERRESGDPIQVA